MVSGNPYYREAFFWDRLRAGRPIILPSDGHRLMQFVYVNDLVDVALKVVALRNAAGHAFNTGNPRAITQHELLLDLAKVAGVKDPQLISIPRERIHRAGGQAIGSKLYFGYYYDVPAITEVITKAQRMLGFRPTDFTEGLEAPTARTRRSAASTNPISRLKMNWSPALRRTWATHGQPKPGVWF